MVYLLGFGTAVGIVAVSSRLAAVEVRVRSIREARK